MLEVFGGAVQTEEGMCKSGDGEEPSSGRQQGVQKVPITCKTRPDSTL